LIHSSVASALAWRQLVALGLPLRPELLGFGQPGGFGQAAGDRAGSRADRRGDVAGQRDLAEQGLAMHRRQAAQRPRATGDVFSACSLDQLGIRQAGGTSHHAGGPRADEPRARLLAQHRAVQDVVEVRMADQHVVGPGDQALHQRRVARQGLVGQQMAQRMTRDERIQHHGAFGRAEHEAGRAQVAERDRAGRCGQRRVGEPGGFGRDQAQQASEHCRAS
jgi:hypothetical protein